MRSPLPARASALVTGLICGALLGGCGTSDDQDPGAVEPPAVSESTARALVEVCPEVEAAVIAADSDDGDDAALLATVTALSEDGDLETQNALRNLVEAVQAMVDAEGADVIDAQGGYIDALDGLADRCEAVGSSALQ